MKRTLKIIKQFSDLVNFLVTNFTAGLILLLTLMILYGVFFRYILNNPLPWILPISKILMIWIGLMGITIAFKNLEHVSMKGLVYMLPDKVQKFFLIVSYGFIALFLMVVLIKGIPIALNANELIMISSEINIPKTWAMLAVPVFAMVNLIHLINLPPLIEQEFVERDRLLDMKS